MRIRNTRAIYLVWSPLTEKKGMTSFRLGFGWDHVMQLSVDYIKVHVVLSKEIKSV